MALPFAQMSFPEIYELALVGPLFQPWAGPILDDVGFAAGDTILDIAHLTLPRPADTDLATRQPVGSSALAALPAEMAHRG